VLLPHATEESRAIAFTVEDQQEAAAVPIRFELFFLKAVSLRSTATDDCLVGVKMALLR
jgi:hypothetical protein